MEELFVTSKKSIIVTSNRTIYTPSSFAKSSLTYLQEIGNLQAKKAHTSSRTKLDSYLFFMVTDGVGSLDYNAMSYQLQTGDCVFIDCQKPYSHTTDPDNLWSLSWIHFNGSSVAAIYNKYLLRGGSPVFHPEEIMTFQSLHTDIFDIASSSDYIRDMKINDKLAALLTLLMAESWNPMKDVEQEKSEMIEVRAYLEEHYAEKISLDNLAEHFFISKYYLTRVFKEQYGVSINNCLLQIRITKAKQLLRFSDEKVEAIGLNCGLGAANYFSSTFKRIEGVSPSDYRRKW